MILNLDFNSEKPIYLQMKDEMIKAIAKGDLKISESLPSVRAMAEEIGINLHTVNKAYNLLKDEGYINIDRRKGAIINILPLDKKEVEQNKIQEEVELLVAKSYLKGIKEDEFLAICSSYYKQYGVKKYE
ncbi:MAG: GntR family transcriptional regulator [Peptostreptococcaceae bacterium]